MTSRTAKKSSAIDAPLRVATVLNSTVMDKYIELAKKLKALADRGLGGEATTAKRILDNYLKKHNLTILDIEGEKKTLEVFRTNNKYKKLFLQVASTVIGIRIDRRYVKRKNPNHLLLEVTKAEKIEINIKYEFYKKHFDMQYDIFFRAFIVKNQLFAFDGEKTDIGSLDEEERKKAFKILEMARNLEKSQYLKQLAE